MNHQNQKIRRISADFFGFGGGGIAKGERLAALGLFTTRKCALKRGLNLFFFRIFAKARLDVSACSRNGVVGETLTPPKSHTEEI